MKYLKCDCGREQAYGRPHFITIQEAESLGWVLIKHQWVCPVCNPALAEQQQYNIEVFVRDFVSGRRVSCGKYQTLVENYVLCVDVSQVVQALMPELFRIEIEFSGKVPNPTCLSKQSAKPV